MKKTFKISLASLVILLFTSFPYQLNAAGPDLIVKSVTVYDGIGPDLSYFIEFENAGTDSCSNYFMVRVYLSSDANITTSDYQIDQIVYAYYLQSGQTFSMSRTDYTVNGVPTGSYYLGAIIDVENTVAESNEGNNTGYDSSLLCPITANPDLIVSYVGVFHMGGTEYRHNLEVYNDSPDPAVGSVKFNSYLSLDQDYDEGVDILFKEFVETDLDMGPYHTFGVGYVPYDVSGLAAPGSYYVVIFADKENTIPESDENNNTGVDAITKIVLPGTGVDVTNAGLPQTFQLYQNKPNPFNSSTLIAYDIPQASPVTLEIYNLLGKQVMIHSPGKQPAGNYTYTWHSGENPSGIYFCRLRAEGRVVTKKMLLQK